MNPSLPPHPAPTTATPLSSRKARRRRTPHLGSLASVAALALVLSACAPDAPGAGSGGGEAPPSGTAGDSASTNASEPGEPAEPVNAEQRDSRAEVASLTPRVVLAHDGGLVTLDGESGEVVHEEALDGFLRLNNAGDGQHVMVTNSDGFEVYNTGIDAQGHGDHFHYYESTPGLTGITFEAPHAGHVVTHHGLTTLFADGDGSIQTFTSEHLKDGPPRTEDTATDAAHHGVALRLVDGTLLTTQGIEEARDTVQVRSTGEDSTDGAEGGEVTAETTDCTGVHGEAAAAANENGDVVVLGCEDGPVVYRDGEFHKIAAETGYQRTGNLAGSEDSPIVLGDLKTDAEAEFERPTQVALIDSLTDELQTVELGSSYWFRSLARGPEGEALVLTYDGELNVIDEETGEITAEIPAIEAWEENEEWQQAGPILKTAGSMAYVTDAAGQQLVVIDLSAGTGGEVVNTFDLDVTPVEMAVVDGLPEAPEHDGGESAGNSAAGHDHEGGDHGH